MQHVADISVAAILLNRFERWEKFGECDLGQESKRPEVDCENGNISLGDCSRCGKQSPVASEDDHEIRLLRSDVIARNRLETLRERCRLGIGNSVVFMIFEPVEQARNQCAQLWMVRF